MRLYKFNHIRIVIVAFVAIVILLLAPNTGNSGSPINGLITVTADPEQEVSPAIAFNSQRLEYLVVWYNDRPGCDDIRARRLSRNGQLLGNPFYISAGCPADRRFPDVVYNPSQDQYLVVWEQEDSSNGYSIQGRRVSGNGQLLDNVDIPIHGPGTNLYTPLKPAVSYASTPDRYLVVWEETWHPMPISYSIQGQVMTAAGTLDGSTFPISEGNTSRGEPDVAYNRHANRYLVVWDQNAGALWDIHGQQVHGGGGLFQGDITIAYYTRSSTKPAVASIPTTPTDDKFLVVWELDYAPNDHDIYGRLIAEDGSPGSDFWISWASGVDESNPAIVSTEGNLQYFVTWRHPEGAVDKPIKGRAFSYTGSPAGSIAEFSGVNAGAPAVASGMAGDLFVVWQDQPLAATNTNIYGQMWGEKIFVPVMLK